MTVDRTATGQVSWSELFPWLLIVRTFFLAFALPLLAVATLGVILQPLGWRLSEALFVSDAMRLEDPIFTANTELLGTWPGQEEDLGARLASVTPAWPFWPTVPFGVDGSPLANVFHRLSLPFRALFNYQLTLPEFAYYLFGALWSLLLWAYLGGIITRMAVVYLGREERVSLKDAAVFVARKYFSSYFAAPLYPLIGVFLLTLPLALLGLLMYFDLGVVLAGLLWIFVLLAAVAMAFILLGLLFGWPLMWPAISAENGDAFEALSRSYGYTYQRPLHYLFYVLVAGVIGYVAWWFVRLLRNFVLWLALWGVAWGLPGSHNSVDTTRQEVVFAAIENPATAGDDVLRAGAYLIRFFNALVFCTAGGFALSFFFCAASAIYLLLRRVDDETEFDEVYVDEEVERYTLPDLTDTESAPASPTGPSGTGPSGSGPTGNGANSNPADGGLADETT